jgi:hypothetical protein
MSDGKLDQLLSALPNEIEPSRDLWPAIHASIAPMSRTIVRRPTRVVAQLAAGLVLVMVSSATTYVLTRQSPAQTAIASFSVMENSDGNAIVADYLRSRTELDHLFAQRIAALPATTRAKLESSLADLRRAEHEIVANLIKNPSDELLHELLLSTYQSEAQLLASVSEIPVADMPRS